MDRTVTLALGGRIRDEKFHSNRRRALSSGFFWRIPSFGLSAKRFGIFHLKFPIVPSPLEKLWKRTRVRGGLPSCNLGDCPWARDKKSQNAAGLGTKPERNLERVNTLVQGRTTVCSTILSARVCVSDNPRGREKYHRSARDSKNARQ